jgi:hypothetical protein
MFCRQCGYNLTGVTTRCPECGRAFAADNPATYLPTYRAVRLRRIIRKCLYYAAALFTLWLIPFTLLGVSSCQEEEAERARRKVGLYADRSFASTPWTRIAAVISLGQFTPRDITALSVHESELRRLERPAVVGDEIAAVLRRDFRGRRFPFLVIRDCVIKPSFLKVLEDEVQFEAIWFDNCTIDDEGQRLIIEIRRHSKVNISERVSPFKSPPSANSPR